MPCPSLPDRKASAARGCYAFHRIQGFIEAPAPITGIAKRAPPFIPPKDHYHIGGSQRSQYDILAWVSENKDNPGMKVR